MDIQVILLCKVMCIGLIILPVNCNTCTANCQTCNINDVVEECTSCNDGYWLSSSTCKICPDNCLTCFSAISCQECKPEFYNLDSACYAHCPTVCLNSVCDDITGHCLECLGGRYGYVCNFDCRLCKNGQCDLRQCTDGCKPGYWLHQVGDHFECRACIADCSSCDTWATCDVCRDGTYLSETTGQRNLCLLCPPSCETCSSYISCSACEPGYYGNACEYPCSAQISDCNMCYWNGVQTVTCNQCTNGFTLQDNTCVGTPQLCPDNCEICTEDEVCEKCKTGLYGLQCDKTCHDIPHCLSCQEVDGSFVCDTCDLGYAAIDGECGVAPTTSTSLTLVSSTTSTPTSISTATKTSSASPNSAVYTPTPQPQNTSFQTSAFAVGLVTGLGICICTMLVVGVVWFLCRRKRLQKSTSTQQNEPFYENSLTTHELKPTHLHAVIENKGQFMEDNQQVPVGEGSVLTSTDIEQHEYTSLDVRQGEHIYKDLTTL